VHSFTIGGDDDDDDAEVIEDDVDLTADDDPEKNGDESEEEEGPDYEPVHKRSKRDFEVVPAPPKVKETPKGKETVKGKETPKGKEATKATAKEKEKETAAVNAVKAAMQKKGKKNGTAKKKEDSPEPELLEIVEDDDDGDEEIASVTLVKAGEKGKKSGNYGVIVLDDDDDDDDIVAGAIKFTTKSSADPNEADDDILSGAIDILVDNPDDDAPIKEPRRPPITATIEEIVPEKYRTLYMSFPSSDPFVNEDTLWTLFAQFGDIEDLVVDEKPSKSKICEGQVVFQRFYAIEACVKAKPLKIDTTPIDIRRTEEKCPENKSQERIHVSGIYHLTTEDLERYFGTFGSVKEAVVLSNRGFGFVEFTDSDSVDKTLLQQYHPIDGLVLEVSRCFTKKPEDKRFKRPIDPRMPKPKPKFDHGPISRGDGANICVTPFPRHVEIKPKKDDGEPIPFDRCASATTAGSVKSEAFKSEIKDEKFSEK